MPSETALPLDSFVTFGDLLKYLRRRARLTQRELAIAVKYSEAQISRLEQNQRPPDLAAVTALFIPALFVEDEPEIVSRLMELAAHARGEEFPRDGVVTFSRSVRQEVIENVRTVEEGALNNLPLQLTSFVGREREMAEIKDFLDQARGNARLVTLTGSGGCGKTRLSLETARGLIGSYQDGVWLIELAPISNPAHVPQAFVAALGLPEPRRETPTAALTQSLRAKRLLLIVDNCEHVLSETAKLVQEILISCPHVQVMATSREILNVPGEIRFRVPSLTLSNDSDSESTRLFVERAKTNLPTFALTRENASHIAQICMRLDGIPLAIELAAARLTALSVKEIAARLENSFQLLTGGSTTLARHQTLQATIAWSYELLSETERALLRRLSVFSGGWALAAAESVASDPALIPVENILDLLTQLVNKSLVIVRWGARGEARYAMLQTIHDFVQEKLRTSGELDSLRARHFDFFLRTAEEAEPRLFDAESSLDWAETEIDNLRAAIAWSLEKEAAGLPSEERTGRGLQLMAHVWPLWLYRGYLTEGRESMKQLLAVHTFPTLARARALLLRADFARADGDYTGQSAFIKESLSLARTLGDKKRIAWALMELAAIESDHHHYAEAIPLHLESLQLFRELKDELWVCRLSYFLAENYLANGDLEAARSYVLQGLDISRAAKDNWHVAYGLEGLGNLERLEGSLQQARACYGESLKLRVEVMDKVGITYLLKAFAQLAVLDGQFERSAILWGAAEKLHQSLGFLPTPLRERFYTTLIPNAREQLGEKSFTEIWNRGRAMNLNEAVEFALK